MQSRLSNDEFTDELTASINKHFSGPAPIQFTNRQVIDMFDGDKIVDHLADVVDNFDAFCDPVEGTTLEIKMGDDDESEYPSQPNLAQDDTSQFVHQYYYEGDDDMWIIRVYKNAVTLTANLYSGEHVGPPGTPFTITVWAHVPKQD